MNNSNETNNEINNEINSNETNKIAIPMVILLVVATVALLAVSFLDNKVIQKVTGEYKDALTQVEAAKTKINALEIQGIQAAKAKDELAASFEAKKQELYKLTNEEARAVQARFEKMEESMIAQAHKADDKIISLEDALAKKAGELEESESSKQALRLALASKEAELEALAQKAKSPLHWAKARWGNEQQ